MSTAPTEEAAGEDPPALRISTVAGTGAAGFAGDGGPAFSAQLNHPNGIAVDSAGNVYVADYDNHRVRKITADGRIGTVAGTGVGQYRGECAPAAASPLRGPRGLAMDSEDTLFIADDSNHLLRKVPAVGTEAGRLRRVAGLGNVGPRTGGFGGDGGPAVSTQLNRPHAVAVDGEGVLYVADAGNHRVRKVTADGKISTLAGTGAAGSSGDGGPAVSARLNRPYAVAVDGEGVLYIADANNHRVRKVTADGKISTLAGTGTAGFGGDGGPASSAHLNRPMGLAFDRDGALHIADGGNHRVRKVAADGTISTVAGTGDAGFAGDGGPAGAAQLNCPMGLAFDNEGFLYIADAENHRVRRVAPMRAGLPASGTVISWANVRSRLRMGVLRESLKDGAEIHQVLAAARDHQRWRLVEVGQEDGDVLYRIENVRSGKVLEIAGAAEAVGASVAQRAYEGSDAHHQQWRLTPAGSPQVYEIANRNSGLLLRVDTNARAVIKQGEAQDDHRGRQWQLLPV